MEFCAHILRYDNLKISHIANMYVQKGFKQLFRNLSNDLSPVKKLTLVFKTQVNANNAVNNLRPPSKKSQYEIAAGQKEL